MRQRRSAFSLVCIAALAAGIAPQSRGADTPAPPPVNAGPAAPAAPQVAALERDVREIMRRTGDAICRIEADDEHGHLRGTGFFIDADGTVLTSYSVGGSCQDIVITVGEQRYPATRLVADERAGIAVLKIVAERPVRFLKFGKSTELAMASIVVTAGYPLNLPLSPSFGPVAGMESGFDGRFFATKHIRANLPVQRGQGGSPILNLRGEVVGVLISMFEGGGGIFALPVEAAQKILHDFHTYRRVRQGWLGVDIRLAENAENGSSARILALREDGPAFAGGIRPGDILLQVGPWKVANPEDAMSAAFFITAAEPLTMSVSRGGRELKFTVTPLDPPNGAMPTIERQPPAILGSSGKGINLAP